MSVKLRFRRMGRKKLPVYGLVATDSRSPRDGRFIEDLGRYEPVAEPAVVKLDADRILYWLSQGAQPSDTVRNLLQKEGVLLRWSLSRKGQDAEAIEAAVAEFKERRAEKAGATKKTRAERRAEALQAERAAAKEKAAELAKARAEREAELQRQREEAEAAERAAAEEARQEAAAAAADSEALTTAADAPAPTADDTPAEEAATEGDAVPQTSSQADGDGDVADQQAEAEAEGGDAATQEATAADVAEEAPDAAEEQPAVEAETADAVADEAGEEVAEQTDAGAAESDAVTEAPAAEATSADDLTAVSGIGPKYSEILTGAGITTFAALAETSVERLQEVITEAGSTTAGNEETWAEQARLLAAGDTEGHAAYLESLKAE